MNSHPANTRSRNDAIMLRLVISALFAALSYIGFAVLRIDLALPGGKTAFHFGNTFLVLASLILGCWYGGVSGAIGMTLADLTTSYAIYAPKTFVLKLCIGLITGFAMKHIFHAENRKTKKEKLVAALASASLGMGFNCIADPLTGYFYKAYILGIETDLAKALAKLTALTTFVNAILAVLIAANLYLILLPALRRIVGRERV